jgi:hypothetical protein
MRIFVSNLHNTLLEGPRFAGSFQTAEAFDGIGFEAASRRHAAGLSRLR